MLPSLPVRYGIALRDWPDSRLQAWIESMGLLNEVEVVPASINEPHTHVRLTESALKHWLPNMDSTGLPARLASRQATGASIKADRALELEIAVAMLGAQPTLSFASIDALQSSIRVRRYIAQAAARTALAFKTAAAERPAEYWREDENAGFVLRQGAPLIDALRAATQPEITGRLYDFSCYRATEYVILLGLAMEMREHHPALLEKLQARCEQQMIRSGQFHDVFLIEVGSLESPVPARFYIPGDRVWFRNPDPVSADASGFEGSWVIYLGGGLFGNFWKREAPFTLTSKCLEIYHWRDAVYLDADGEPRINETRVDELVAATKRDPAAQTAVLDRMMRMRDAKGVYAEGGCLDATREYPRSVWPSSCELRLPRWKI